uniref:MARVEL domain-containing protein n=1 Tax=Rhabditophanes sp. KR3021 TaxID=114890 RepID=A0AC35U5H6_9BILA
MNYRQTNDPFTNAIPLKSQKDNWFRRIPFASIVALLMCITGVIMFACMMIWSFNASVEQSRRALHIDNLPWLDKIRIFFIALTGIMILISIFMLIVGIMSTGSTREKLYKNDCARSSGRFSCAAAIIISYLSNIFWYLIISLSSILCFIYYIFLHLCFSLSSYNSSNCLDFTLFKPFVKEYSNAPLILCGGDVQQFCALTNTVFTWYIVGFVGSIIVSMGLTNFMICNASNYAQISNDKRYLEIKELCLYEDSLIEQAKKPLRHNQPYIPAENTNPYITEERRKNQNFNNIYGHNDNVYRQGAPYNTNHGRNNGYRRSYHQT